MVTHTAEMNVAQTIYVCWLRYVTTTSVIDVAIATPNMNLTLHQAGPLCDK
jgi:hypothetical protein